VRQGQGGPELEPSIWLGLSSQLGYFVSLSQCGGMRDPLRYKMCAVPLQLYGPI